MDDAAVSGTGLGSVQVADVLAEEDTSATGKGHRIFEMPADGKGGGKILCDKDRRRDIPAGASEDDFAFLDDLDDGIIGVSGDGTVVDEEEVGNSGEALQGFMFVGANRLIGEVSTGGYYR